MKRLGHEAPHHSPDELARLQPTTDALVSDLTHTLGWPETRARDLVASIIATSFLGEDPEWIALNLAENVQQELHDSFIDATWPACPHHATHPLWLRQDAGDLWWTCTQDETHVARLGQLGN